MNAPPALHEAARNALAAALATGEQRTLLEHGPMYTHAVIAGLAGLIAHYIDIDSDGLWSIEATSLTTGQRIGLDDTDLPACERAAIRAITAASNKDHDTLAAIVKAAWSSLDEAALLLAAVVHLTADVVRLYGEQQ